jgi:hypothetical protein
MGVLKGLWIVTALAGAGCFAPSGRDCAVTCSAMGGCPSGFACLSDGYCHEGGDRELCGAALDGGGDSAPPGDAPPQTRMLDMTADADTFIEDTPRDGDNFGGDVAIGVDGAVSSGNQMVGLVHFDLSGVPPGTVLSSAPVLRLCTTDDAFNAGTVTMYEVLERWSEGLGARDAVGDGDPGVANWTQRMAGTTWTTAGAGTPGSRDATAATVGGAVLTPSAPDTAYTVELETAVVQGWIDDANANFGLAIVPSADAGGGFFVAREGTVPDCQPKLTVAYLE